MTAVRAFRATTTMLTGSAAPSTLCASSQTPGCHLALSCMATPMAPSVSTCPGKLPCYLFTYCFCFWFSMSSCLLVLSCVAALMLLSALTCLGKQHKQFHRLSQDHIPLVCECQDVFLALSCMAASTVPSALMSPRQRHKQLYWSGQDHRLVLLFVNVRLCFGTQPYGYTNGAFYVEMSW